MRTLSIISVLAVAMLVAGVPALGSTPLAAQEFRFSPDGSVLSATMRGGGWLGMQITHEVPSPRTAETGRWIIAGVVEDAPADIAGVEEGDELLSINGTPISEEVLEDLTSGLQAGDEVALRLRRDSRTVELTLEAQIRPIMVVRRSGSPQAIALRGDSILIRMLGAMDSIRPGVRFDLERLPETMRETMRGDTLRVWQFFGDSLQGAPFAFRGDSVTGGPFAFRGDSITWGPKSSGPDPFEALPWLHFDAFRARPGDAPEAFEGRPWPEAFMRPSEDARGPAAIYRAGQRVVAGAEVTPVNEGLSTYFGVTRGVLAVEVVPGSLLHDAGLRAGDVIVRVDGREVSTVSEFRAGFDEGWRSPPVSVEIVRDRQDRTLTVGR